MIEKELIGAHFLAPAKPIAGDGYLDRTIFSQLLQQGAVIGQYNAENQFTVDAKLTQHYKKILSQIAKAFAYDIRDKHYRRYKLGSLDKGTLNFRLEWNIAQLLHMEEMSFAFAKQIQVATGCIILIVDMGEPAYEVLVPDTVVRAFGKSEFIEMKPL